MLVSIFLTRFGKTLSSSLNNLVKRQTRTEDLIMQDEALCPLATVTELANILLAHPALADGDWASPLAYAHLLCLKELADERYDIAVQLSLGEQLLQGRLRNPLVDPFDWKTNACVAMGTAQSSLDYQEKMKCTYGFKDFKSLLPKASCGEASFAKFKATCITHGWPQRLIEVFARTWRLEDATQRLQAK